LDAPLAGAAHQIEVTVVSDIVFDADGSEQPLIQSNSNQLNQRNFEILAILMPPMKYTASVRNTLFEIT
jgi:hypothetical protein